MLAAIVKLEANVRARSERGCLLKALNNIRQRCNNPRNPAYPDYGGRGITICQRWNTQPKLAVADFSATLGPKPSQTHSVERIRVNDGYWCGRCEDCVSKGQTLNVRWASSAEQTRNRRSNRNLTWNGETKTATDWAQQFGIPQRRFLTRIRAGWSIEDARKPVRHQSRRTLTRQSALPSDESTK